MATLVPLLLLAVSCTPDDDPVDGAPTDDPTTDTATPGDTVSVEVSAVDGGEVSFGAATLSIPPGALVEDTTIVVGEADSADLAGTDTLASAVWRFGPTGLRFLLPATLTVEVASEAPAGLVHVVSWYDESGSTWVNLPTTADGLVVWGEIRYLTRFAVRSVDPADAWECAAVPGCGGDPVGRWTVVGACRVAAMPPMEGCPTSTPSMLLEAEGVYEFADDQSYAWDLTLSATVRYVYPPECVPPRFTCADLDPSCTGDPTEGCTCVTQAPPQTTSIAGTWSVEETELVTEVAGLVASRPFCIDGDTMWTVEGATMLTLRR